MRCVAVVIADTPPPFHHQGLPVADHHFHHHIEDGGQKWISLFHASFSTEGFSVLPYCLHHHLNPIPIPAEEAEGPGPHAISLQDVQEPGPVKGIICLVQVQEDCVEHHLPYGCNLL